MGRSFNTVGGGSNTNLNGLAFEREKDLLDSLKKETHLLIEDTYSYSSDNPEYLTKYRPFFNSFPNNKLKEQLKKSHIVRYTNGVIIGEIISKYALNDYLLHNGINYKKINSKMYLPDDAFINYRTNELYIIEKKYQNGSGSVAEKLETFVFKREKYEKLFMLKSSSEKGLLYKDCGLKRNAKKNLVSKVNYIFVGNDFFDQNCFDDVFNYMEKNNISYFVNKEIPISVLGIEYDNKV